MTDAKVLLIRDCANPSKRRFSRACIASLKQQGGQLNRQTFWAVLRDYEDTRVLLLLLS